MPSKNNSHKQIDNDNSKNELIGNHIHISSTTTTTNLAFLCPFRILSQLFTNKERLVLSDHIVLDEVPAFASGYPEESHETPHEVLEVGILVDPISSLEHGKHLDTEDGVDELDQ